MESTEKKQDIVRHALDVFRAHGVHATGISKVLSGTGISKRTLYKYFESKEDLVMATLDLYNEEFGDALKKALEEVSGGSREKILHIFTLKQEALERGEAPGCYLIQTRVEFEGKHEGIESSCAKWYREIEALFLSLLEGESQKEKESLSRQLACLLQGAIVVSQHSANTSIFKEAKEAVAKLLKTS